ncbi:Crp/Fnr family transcriptional regulator [Fluviispira multicolorata]|nr:cyclic nucleotide-binding domain-containing protein [Fluviispira multicolorata]
MKPDTLSFAPLQIIFNEGEESNGIYLIQEGVVEIFRVREGTEINLGTLKQNDVLGTLTVLSKEPRTASARATVKCTVLFFQSDGLKNSFKEIPVWSQAVIKDAIGRVKHVNELLIESKLNEKKLLRNVGSSHHHSAQLAYLLASLVRKGAILNDSQVSIYPTKDFVTCAELILMKKYTYLEQIFKAFNECGLVKEIDDKKYGKILFKPSPGLLEEFAVYSLNIAKKGSITFLPQKFYPWMSAVARISKKNNSQEKFKRSDLAILIQTELGREDGEFLVSELIQHEVLSEKDNFVTFTTSKLQKTVVFESLSRILKDIVP